MPAALVLALAILAGGNTVYETAHNVKTAVKAVHHHVFRPVAHTIKKVVKP